MMCIAVRSGMYEAPTMNSNCHKLILINTATLQKLNLKELINVGTEAKLELVFKNKISGLTRNQREVQPGLPLFVPLLLPQSRKVKIF